jgi:hypothetical protein
MPLAQNYKDDVSLLESETPLTKTTINCINREPAIPSGFHMHMNVS